MRNAKYKKQTKRKAIISFFKGVYPNEMYIKNLDNYYSLSSSGRFKHGEIVNLKILLRTESVFKSSLLYI